MMLDFDQRNRLRGGAGARELGRKIFRVLVGDQRDGPMIEQLGVKRERAAIVVERLGVLQIALVLRQDRLAVLDEAERRLELAAHRQQWRRRLEAARQRERGRGEAARAPQQAGLAGHHARHRIVDPIGDLAIMDERVRRDLRQPFARLVIVGRLRFVGEVAAGHHHRAIQSLQQQSMQRRRRQHEAERREPRRDVLRQTLRPVGAQQNDRGRGSAEQPLLLAIDGAIAADDLDIGRHQRERLFFAALQPAQARDRLGVGRVASEVKSAQSLDRDDFALLQEGAGRIDVVEGRSPGRKRTGAPSKRMSVARGPQAWQAIASAWKRRSAGFGILARRPRT